MGKILLISISLFSTILFLVSGISRTPAFAETYEGIKITKLEDSGCIYKDQDPDDPFARDVVKNVNARNGYVLTLNCVPILFMNLIFWALSFAGLVALLLVIFGGFKYMTSAGDQKAVDGAKKTITWAIIGLVVIILSFAIVRFIADMTGLTCLTRFGFIGVCE